jgi:hypothetical protein
VGMFHVERERVKQAGAGYASRETTAEEAAGHEAMFHVERGCVTQVGARACFTWNVDV